MRKISLLAVLLSMSFNLVSQILFAEIASTTLKGKGGLKNIVRLLPELISNPLLWISLITFFIGSMCWVIALRGMALSKAFAISSLGYVFITLYAWYFLHEAMHWNKIASLLLIIAGVILITQPVQSGSSREAKVDQN